MPELPEVEMTLRAVAPLLQGRTIKDVEVLRPNMILRYPDFVEKITGRTILGMKRHGKYLWMELSDDLNLLIHLKMSGRLGIRKVKATPFARERIRFSIDKDLILIFNNPRTLGRLWIIEGKDVYVHPSLKSLGPDALTVTKEVFMERLAKKRGRLKAVLLNQTFIAGVGNIYADEACFRARLDPRRKVTLLTTAEKNRLYIALVATLNKGIKSMDTSFSDFAELKGKPGQNQKSLMVYSRKDKKCRKCPSLLHSAKIGQRTTVWCPTCQK